MNNSNQLWALLKFQWFVLPRQFLLFGLLAIGLAPFFFSMISHDPPALSFLLSNQQLFLVAILGYTLLAPELATRGAGGAQWPTATEFILTRAVDKRLVLRARALGLLVIVVALPLAMLPAAMINPVLRVRDFDDAEQHLIMQQLPGSTYTPAVIAGRSSSRIQDILIPYGAVEIESWRLWILVSLIMVTEFAVMLIYPLKHRRYYLWGIIAVITGAFLAPELISINTHRTDINLSIFLIFAANQLIFWPLTLALAGGCQMWSEWRFANAEH